MERTHTARGFALINFEDCYGNQCSIQESSSASQDKIWFGVNDASPKILASNATKFGIVTDEQVGWVEYPIPDEVLLNTRMHLTVDQVRELIPILERFVETGKLE